MRRLALVLVVGGCPSGPSSPAVSNAVPAATASQCAPSLVAFQDKAIRIPRPMASVVAADDMIDGIEVTAGVGYLMWSASWEHDDVADQWPRVVVDRFREATGVVPAVIAHSDQFASTEIASRWDDAGSSFVLEVSAQGNDPYPMYLKLTCRDGVATPLSLAEAGRRVAELDPARLPDPLRSALADRQIVTVSLAIHWKPFYQVSIPLDEAWVVVLHRRLLDSGYTQTTKDDRTTFTSADYEIEFSQREKLLVIEVSDPSA